jgi:formiminotetrahydrofolate cyclodeaminase
MRGDDAKAALARWIEHGATWRIKDITDTEAVVELCSCSGDPIDELRSQDAAFLRYLRGLEDRGAPETASLLDQTYGSVLDAFAAGPITPGGGSAAALVGAMAAALAERCLAAAPGHVDDSLRARGLRERLLELADQDCTALRELVDALDDGAGVERSTAISTAAFTASGPARQLQAAAAEVAELATAAARDTSPRLRAEAECAVTLAHAAERAAEDIIVANDGLGRAR